ncbi:Stp1/IreP family PP2C-type Ser/Thr phosphatase [Undibacterium aquatile]|uniref:Stp1/IreP family PP2C-type Ser/Thr phosphatase n=1 Tax=Undibacterium aquatile TaxID=1537398 RepID=A0ABR6XCI6_9BURK|nr:Stp1/IreP family PP2C-type Ser/Thr phosphatase [Undibacterium aquatile]MBC3810634.1 Stp1/IreP family PP2C-type Ser/Thr phosphatase [Undibacterium aquatile]
MSHQYVLEFAALSDIGRVRKHNEDAIVVCADYGCVVLADGMGGYKAGEVASAMTAKIVADYLCAKLDSAWYTKLGFQSIHLSRWISDAIHLANRQVVQTSQENPECFGMGTTVVVACCTQDKILFAHVGDSRAYRYRNHALVRMTEDHSVLQEQINAGLISESQARFSTIKNLITRAVGTQENIEVDLSVHQADETDVYMLCSDGLTDLLADDQIQDILRQYEGNLQACCRALIDCANEAGGFDNTSVVLFKLKAVSGPSWVEKLLFR